VSRPPGRIALALLATGLLAACVAREPDRPPVRLTFLQFNYPGEFGGFLQVSGLTFAFDPARPPGQRVARALVGGQPLDPERRYSVAVNNYTAQGGDGYRMLATAKPLVFPEDGPGLAETLLEAIERAGSIAPVTEGRITRTSP
jgi:2',3'-cyclic-nucleotide 2'-phosphodiesterase (5'-nucleotidase family)